MWFHENNLFLKSSKTKEIMGPKNSSPKHIFIVYNSFFIPFFSCSSCVQKRVPTVSFSFVELIPSLHFPYADQEITTINSNVQ